MYKHILIPTDGSELSNNAVEHGVALAKAVGAKITVITVSMPYSFYAGEMSTAVDQREYQKSTSALAAKLLGVAKDIAAAANMICDVLHVEHAQPYQAIIEAAQKRGCDLIVMASHGRRGVSAIVLGSETVKVLTHSAIPVLVVRAPPRRAAAFAAS